MPRDTALEIASTYFETGALQRDLAALVAFETESQTATQKPQLARYLTEAIIPRLEAMGFELTVHDNPDPAGGPILTATAM